MQRGENRSRSYAVRLVPSPQRWPRAGVMSPAGPLAPKGAGLGARPEIPGGVVTPASGMSSSVPCRREWDRTRVPQLGTCGSSWPSAKGAGTQPAPGTAGNRSCLPSLLFQQAGADRFTGPGRCLSIPSCRAASSLCHHRRHGPVTGAGHHR